MSDDSGSPIASPAPLGAASAPAVNQQFDELISAFTEATNAGKDEEAHAASMKLLSLAEEEEERNPSPEVQLLNQADMLESQGEWAAAETVRRQILARAELSDNFGWMVRAQGDLSRHLRTVGRLDEAWELAVAAVASSRHFKRVLSFQVRALTNQMHCALRRGDSDQALASAVEALALVEPGKLHDQARARALTNRARCRLACGDLVGAGLDLAAGWELLRKDPRFCNLPGPLWALGNWWEVKSQLETRLGDRASAREALTQAIEYRRQNEGAYELVALAHALGRLGKLLRAEGDEVGEERCLSEASSILEALNLPVATSRAWNFEADDITHGKQYYPRAE